MYKAIGNKPVPLFFAFDFIRRKQQFFHERSVAKCRKGHYGRDDDDKQGKRHGSVHVWFAEIDL